MGESAYSYSLTTFSPSGKLVQIEYALSAVTKAPYVAGPTTLRPPFESWPPLRGPSRRWLRPPPDLRVRVSPASTPGCAARLIVQVPARCAPCLRAAQAWRAAYACAQDLVGHQGHQWRGPGHREEDGVAAHGPDLGAEDLQPDGCCGHRLLWDGPGLPRSGQEGPEGGAAVLPRVPGKAVSLQTTPALPVLRLPALTQRAACVCLCVVQELMPLSQLSRELATTMQEFTQQGCVHQQRSSCVCVCVCARARARARLLSLLFCVGWRPGRGGCGAVVLRMHMWPTQRH